jgi:hypothetical protein
MTQEEIEQSFVEAGWEMYHSSERLLAGGFGDLSILAYGSSIGTEDPAFEIVDRERVVTYWVRVIPSPHVAAVLLREHGGPPEKGRGKPVLQTG